MIQCLFSNEVKVWSIPHVDGLRSENIIEFVVNKLAGEDYLPSNYFIYYTSRTWLCNLGKLIIIVTILSKHHRYYKIHEICKRCTWWKREEYYQQKKSLYEHWQKNSQSAFIFTNGVRQVLSCIQLYSE